jgi:hypothetical protein
MDNYIGPYWSDGKWQQSVEFGGKEPLSELDAAARLHDSAYARFSDQQRRTAADVIFSETVKKLDDKRALIGDLPLYGNYVKNRAGSLLTDFATGVRTAGLVGGLGAVVYNGVKGMVLNHDLAINLPRYKREVAAYYRTDPVKGKQESYDTDIVTPTIDRPVIHKPLAREAPETTQKEENTTMFKRKDKIAVAPAEPGRAERDRPVVINPVTATYRPLRRKKRRVQPADVLLYLKYHPGEEQRVLAWLEKHPLQ